MAFELLAGSWQEEYDNIEQAAKCIRYRTFSSRRKLGSEMFALLRRYVRSAETRRLNSLREIIYSPLLLLLYPIGTQQQSTAIPLEQYSHFSEIYVLKFKKLPHGRGDFSGEVSGGNGLQIVSSGKLFLIAN
ncbi:hypothetical protein CEXT_474581 [Caerostris extrusa]|uniref:Uncharacterized protein n=1 Tax=Caerostris extrusa TaxID=172846 RepID=A0AAV4RFZ4_CAEEX|nr:hypothetical protein CEXT_474581 [Caerostris extrusa]